MGKSRASRLRRNLKEEKDEKLYVFLWHFSSFYSLYALDVPNADDTIPTTTTTTTTTAIITTKTTTTATSSTTTTSTTTTTVVGEPQPHRVHIEPVLRFSKSNRNWPENMTCVSIKSKLYFMGGYVVDHGNILTKVSTREVFILDLSTAASEAKLRSCRDRPLEILKRGPDMHTGKPDPVSFEADGKIFVLSGQNRCYWTGEKFKQLEIFSPAENKWEVGADPPFNDLPYFGSHVVVDRKVIVSGPGQGLKRFCFFSYDLDSKKWSEFDFGVDNFCFGLGSQFIGDTLYTVYGGRVVPLRREESPSVLAEIKVFDVIKYKIPKGHSSGGIMIRVGDKRLCYVQVGSSVNGFRGNPPTGHCYISVTAFDVFGEGDSAEYINSAHYISSKTDTVEIVAAYLV